MLARAKQWARRIKQDVHALYLAARDPRTPWLAKLVAAGVVAYAVSPIDLIPDFVPVLGYLDDLILIPLGIALAIRLIPRPVMAECRVRAEQTAADRGSGRVAAAVIVAIWIAATVAGLAWAYTRFG
jgi:uncharacterized membrane protein YkvA (DUF1232 family)